MASLNFLVNRLLTFPLTKERFEKERKIIQNVARWNGFEVDIVNQIIRKQKFKKLVQNSTTFQTTPDSTKFVTIPFAPFVTKGLSKVFKELDLKVVHTSGSTLQNLLGNPKDKVGVLGKSGIYEISCNDCDHKYIGQTRRSVTTRFKEHMAHLRFGRFERSSVAQHIYENDHIININNVKLIRAITNCKFLDAWESLEIHKNLDKLMNSDSGPLPRSPLYSLVAVGSGRKVGGTTTLD